MNTPGIKNIGEKNTGPPSLTIIEMESETTLESMTESQPSMLAISCVQRVMILDAGVSSSQLERDGGKEWLLNKEFGEEKVRAYRNVAPRTESISCALIDREAFNDPKI